MKGRGTAAAVMGDHSPAAGTRKLRSWTRWMRRTTCPARTAN